MKFVISKCVFWRPGILSGVANDLCCFFFAFQLPTRVHEAMQMQVEAERRKRAAILESEGIREADINVAEGKRQSRILASGSFISVGNNNLHAEE